MSNKEKIELLKKFNNLEFETTNREKFNNLKNESYYLWESPSGNSYEHMNKEIVENNKSYKIVKTILSTQNELRFGIRQNNEYVSHICYFKGE